LNAESEPPPSGEAETATYIAGMAKELRTMAAKVNLGFLAYLLAMVEEDAAETARRLSRGKS
jgi:hypothetical protein